MASGSPTQEYETQFEALSSDDQCLWDAVEIIKEKNNRYLVRWAGLDPNTNNPWEPSWVLKHDCTNDLIQEWKATKAKKGRIRKKGRVNEDESAYIPSSSKVSSASGRSGDISQPSSGPLHRTYNRSRIPASKVVSPMVEISSLKKGKKRPRESSHSDASWMEEEEDSSATSNWKRRKLSRPLHPREEDVQSEASSYDLRPYSKPWKHSVVMSSRSSPEVDALSEAPPELSISPSHQEDSHLDDKHALSENARQRGIREPSATAREALKEPTDSEVRSQPGSVQDQEWNHDSGGGGEENFIAENNHDSPQLPMYVRSESNGILSGPHAPVLGVTSVNRLRNEIRNAEEESFVDVVRLDDVADTNGVIPRSSGEVIQATPDNVEATGPWTQNSHLPQQQTDITPTKQLDRALGLLHRKSEEIEALQSRLSKVMDIEKRYGEMCVMVEMMQAQQAEKKTEPTDEERVAKLVEENERLRAANKDTEDQKDLLRDLYVRASDAHQAILEENKNLRQDNQSFREQATTGVKQAAIFWKSQVSTLEMELVRVRGKVKVYMDQALRTDDDLRRRAALLPVAQQETSKALEKVEELKDVIRGLGQENTSLRLEIKDWTDEAMARKKKEEATRHEESAEDESVWVCLWMDEDHASNCAALFASREKLSEHIYEAGHIPRSS